MGAQESWSHLRTDSQFIEQLFNEQTRVMWIHQGESPMDREAGAPSLLLTPGPQALEIIGNDRSGVSFLGVDPDGFSLVAVHLKGTFAMARALLGRLFIRAVIGMALGFAYFVADNFGLAMGNLGAYPPLLAAWGPFFLFLLIGETVLIQTEE